MSPARPEAPPGSLLRSVAFRLTIVYALLFVTSVLVLFGFFYWSTAGYLARQTDATIEAEIGGLAERYRSDGLPGLTSLISQRLSRQPAGSSVYLLTGRDLVPLVGNLDRWPDADPDAAGWVTFRLGEPGGGETTNIRLARAQVFRLQGGFNLLVGRDMQELDAIQGTVVRTLGWGVLISVLLALLGGAMMSRSMGSRIAAINHTVEQIMAGDLSRRMNIDESGDDFDQLAGNLNRMLDRIESLMDGVRHVSDNIAHDLRTPLARLRNQLETLRAEVAAPGASETARVAVEDAVVEADRLLATFGALLRIARIEATARRESFGAVDLAALAADAAELYEPLAEERGQSITLDAGVASITGDRDLLFQALANLLDNAIKYAPAGGEIGIRVTTDERGAALSVTDNGPGLPEAQHRRAFERFWRLDDSRSSPGSGLGLSLVEAVAQLHGAEVRLGDNVPGLHVELVFPG